MIELLDRLERLSSKLTKPTAVIGILGLLLIAVITIATVVARGVFNYPIIWGHDIAALIVIILVATCFPTGVLERKHIAIEFLGAALGPRGRRVLNTLAAAVTAVALVVLAWQLSKVAYQEFNTRSTTIVARIPTGYSWLIAAAVVWVAVPIQILVTLQAAAGREPSRENEDLL